MKVHPTRSRLPLTRASKQQAEQNKTSKRKATDYDNLSPTSKKFKKRYNDMVLDEAYKELMSLRASNAGRPIFKDISTIVEKFKKRGHGLVERWHLEYRIAMAKKGKCVKNLPAAKQHLFQFDNGSISTGIADKAMDGCDDTERTDPCTDISDLTKSTINTDEAVVEIKKPKRKGGRPKGSTDENDRLHDIAIAKALTIAATKCYEAKQKALESGEVKVKEGTNDNIIDHIRTNVLIDNVFV